MYVGNISFVIPSKFLILLVFVLFIQQVKKFLYRESLQKFIQNSLVVYFLKARLYVLSFRLWRQLAVYLKVAHRSSHTTVSFGFGLLLILYGVSLSYHLRYVVPLCKGKFNMYILHTPRVMHLHRVSRIPLA